MGRILRVLVYPFAVVVMALMTGVAAVSILVLTTFAPKRSYAPVYWWARVLLGIFGVRYRVVGRENAPPDQPYVVISNHSSHMDGPTVILAVPRPVYFVIKKELTKIPVWGWTALRVGFIAVDRSDPATARKQMKRAAETIRSGRWVLVFPEGTRSPDDRLMRFKKGGFHLAVDAQVPILPVAVNGSRSILPKGKLIPRPGTIEVVIGEPIPTAGRGKEDVGELVAETRRAIAQGRRRDPTFVPDEP